MSNHVTEWLNAYLDAELHGSQLQHVEAHLAECQACQSELESLERLSGLLQESPARHLSASTPDRDTKKFPFAHPLANIIAWECKIAVPASV